MKNTNPILALAALLLLGSCLAAVRSDLPPGYPDRSPGLDVLPGFRNPPPGYGEVPFWWWTGDDLNAERLKEQIRELHKKGISGVQVNYSHLDTPGWPTDHKNPPIFTDEWWKIYSDIAAECKKLGMGIGLSTYTLDWPEGADNLFHRLIYSKEELNALELRQGVSRRVKEREKVVIPLTRETEGFHGYSWSETEAIGQSAPGRVGVWAYPVKEGKLQREVKDITAYVTGEVLKWTAPEG